MDKLREAMAATEKTWEAYKKAKDDAIKASKGAIASKLEAYREACRAYEKAEDEAWEASHK